MKKTILIIGGVIFIFLITISFRPLDNSKENSFQVSGVLESVSEGGVKDLVFKLEDDKITYYINRGLENGFSLEKIKTDYVGKKVVLNYAKAWTILAPFGTNSKHITQISVDGKEIYSEWK